MSPISSGANEWLETDGLGGFASGTVDGIRTRRYHALLLTATTPPTGRFVLVNGFDAWLETATGTTALSSQRYGPGVVHPDGHTRLESFTVDPWPRWVYQLEGGTRITQELFVPHGQSAVALRWRVSEPGPRSTLTVRPFLSGRDYHSLHHENSGFRFEAACSGERTTWCPYPGVPGIIALSNGVYAYDPQWYRNFLYAEEGSRGLDAAEDLASPGVFRWDLTRGEAVLVFGVDDPSSPLTGHDGSAESLWHTWQKEEATRRTQFPTRLHRAADAYLVRRGHGKTVIAGYPWFTDWGRDTFIALRGLCLATGRLDDARDILLDWSGTVSEGMLPNLFPDRGHNPEFNSVDASLWYIIAVHDYLERAAQAGHAVSPADRSRLEGAIEAILTGYHQGTRYGIRCDSDGLLAAGVPGVQLTWMDAKVGDWVVTPRIGKPVEVQALWLNALRIGIRFMPRWQPAFERGRRAFQERFWVEQSGSLYDLVDPDHRSGVDQSFRPNQIFAVGGLPYPILEGDRARRVVDAVEAHLLTPLGLRSLAPGSPSYAPRYEGGVLQRDGSYHQGTVWPWLLGPFVEAWVRVRGNTAAAKTEARKRFLEPLLQHLDEAGLGHASEIADAEPPHTPRGCPFQAWSLGELLRLHLTVLDDNHRSLY